jgi:hypothetical protein
MEANQKEIKRANLPPVTRRLNAHHDPPLVPLRRNGHTAVQLDGTAE